MIAAGKHLIALAGAVLLCWFAFSLGAFWPTWLAVLAGAYLALALEAALRAWLRSLHPQTREERAIMLRFEQRVRSTAPRPLHPDHPQRGRRA